MNYIFHRKKSNKQCNDELGARKGLRCQPLGSTFGGQFNISNNYIPLAMLRVTVYNPKVYPMPVAMFTNNIADNKVYDIQELAQVRKDNIKTFSRPSSRKKGAGNKSNQIITEMFAPIVWWAIAYRYAIQRNGTKLRALTTETIEQEINDANIYKSLQDRSGNLYKCINALELQQQGNIVRFLRDYCLMVQKDIKHNVGSLLKAADYADYADSHDLKGGWPTDALISRVQQTTPWESTYNFTVIKYKKLILFTNILLNTNI